MKNTFTILLAFVLACFYQPSGAQWCTPLVIPYGPTTPGITNFILNTINRTSAPIEDPYNGYVLTDVTTTLVRGQTYTISITHTIDQPFCPDMNLRVWIDYNVNYTLNDAGETVLSTDHHLAGTYTATFTVPLTATLGITRLRATAKMSNLGGHSLPTPCNFPLDPVGYHGEVEDYAVTIAAETGIGDPVSAINSISVFPNPAGSSTTVSYSLSKNAQVTAELCNTLGQRVRLLADEKETAGIHEYALDMKNLQAGLYLIKITTDSGTQTQQMIVTGE